MIITSDDLDLASSAAGRISRYMYMFPGDVKGLTSSAQRLHCCYSIAYVYACMHMYILTDGPCTCPWRRCSRRYSYI